MVDKKGSIKEGGKKGVDICGMCDLGGVKYFNVTIDGANGELEALDFVLEGMNAPVDETAEERKGGAGHLGKLLYSAAEGGSAMALLCNIPKALQEERPEVSMGAWVLAVLKAAVGTKIGKIESSAEVVKVLLECDASAGVFPLKVRDATQEAGFAYLRENNCLPAGGDDSDDDYVPDLDAEGISW